MTGTSKDGGNSMTNKRDSADASFYYRESAAADTARMDSSAVYGNLADAMKNATLLIPSPRLVDSMIIDQPPEVHDK